MNKIPVSDIIACANEYSEEEVELLKKCFSGVTSPRMSRNVLSQMLLKLNILLSEQYSMMLSPAYVWRQLGKNTYLAYDSGNTYSLRVLPLTVGKSDDVELVGFYLADEYADITATTVMTGKADLSLTVLFHKATSEPSPVTTLSVKVFEKINGTNYETLNTVCTDLAKALWADNVEDITFENLIKSYVPEHCLMRITQKEQS